MRARYCLPWLSRARDSCEGLSMHQFWAADLNGLGAVFYAVGYAGLSGLRKRLKRAFPGLGGALWAACNAGAGAGAGAMTVFTV